MKLSTWAKRNGISYMTAYRMFKNNTLPIPAEQFATGTIIVHPVEPCQVENKIALYGRVSSQDQSEDLTRQMERLRLFAAQKGLIVYKEVAEIASGLNDHRTKLLTLLQDPVITTVVVEHRDRLARFGVNTMEAILSAHGRKLLVMNEAEEKHELVQDFIDVVTSMCSRIYGKRSAYNRAKRAVAAASVDKE
ncbi:MAG: IS607 family transposase [Patescibacteria group bacterium]